MNVQAKAAAHKAAHPELYCPERRCLWRTGGGWCPRHAREADELPDVRVVDEGTLVLFELHSDEAREWWDENVAEGPRWFGAVDGRVVEHRYAPAIIEGLLDAGLVLA